MSSDRCNKYPASSGYIFAVSCRAKSNRLLTTVQIRPEIWTNKLQKKRVFPVIDRFRALLESCLADQSCHNSFFSDYRGRGKAKKLANIAIYHLFDRTSEIFGVAIICLCKPF